MTLLTNAAFLSIVAGLMISRRRGKPREVLQKRVEPGPPDYDPNAGLFLGAFLLSIVLCGSFTEPPAGGGAVIAKKKVKGAPPKDKRGKPATVTSRRTKEVLEAAAVRLGPALKRLADK